MVRSGPITPVVPAAASVWHEAHVPTPVKIALPAAGVVPAAPVLAALELVDVDVEVLAGAVDVLAGAAA